MGNWMGVNNPFLLKKTSKDISELLVSGVKELFYRAGTKYFCNAWQNLEQSRAQCGCAQTARFNCIMCGLRMCNACAPKRWKSDNTRLCGRRSGVRKQGCYEWFKENFDNWKCSSC